eukprot:tig00020509_g9764.t1
MFSVVKDAYEVAEFDGLWGRDRLILLRSDAGLVVPVAELRRILIYAPDEPPEDPDRALADLYRVPCRPVASEETILLLEMLGVIRRGAHRPDGNPPRVVSLRHAEQIVCERWDEDPGVSARKRCVARHILAAIERRRLESFERVELRVLRLGPSSAARVFALRCKRIEVPDVEWYAPIASLAQAAYGSSRDVPSLRAEIRRKHPDLGADSPFRFEARTDVTLTLYAGLNAEVEGEATRGAARKWGFISLAGAERILQGLPRFGDELLVPFRRQRLALEGADAAEIEAAAPLPLAPARRIAIFTKREWLTDQHIANCLSIVLARASAAPRVRALYPMTLDIATSLLRRHARASPEKRRRRALGAAEEGRVILCPVSGGLVRRGSERTWSAGGHWTLLVISGDLRRTRYFDSLGARPDPSLERAAKKAFPSFEFEVETQLRLQADGYQCGIWVLYFAESVVSEALLGFPWDDELRTGAIHYLRTKSPSYEERKAINGRFIAGKREHFRSLLESALVGDVYLFCEADVADPERVTLPPPAAAGEAAAAAAAAAAEERPRRRADGGTLVISSSSSSSSSSAPSDEADEAEGGAADGGADGEAEGLELAAAPEASEGEGEGEGAAAEGGRSRPEPYALPEAEWSRELRAQMKLFEEWRTRAINPDRAGAAVERSTALTNDVGTVGRFLGYLAAREEVRPLSFDVFSRGDLVDLWMRFLTFLKEERKLTAGTLSGYTSSIIMAAAFVHSRTGAATGSEGPHARALKNVKAQLEKEKREERKWRPRGENWVEYEQVLGARLAALEQYEGAKTDYERAQALREACLLGFLAVTPARVGIIRRLRIGVSLRRDAGAWCIVIDSMRADDGTGEMALASKTARFHGALSIPVAAVLQEPLTLFVERFRRLLIPDGAPDQQWLFTSSAGGVLSESGYGAWVMERWTGKPVSARAMRAVLTTYVRERAAAHQIEGDTAAAVIEGTARLLQHSVQTATTHYDYGARARQAAAAVAPSRPAPAGPGRRPLRVRAGLGRLGPPPPPPPPPPPGGADGPDEGVPVAQPAVEPEPAPRAGAPSPPSSSSSSTATPPRRAARRTAPPRPAEEDEESDGESGRGRSGGASSYSEDGEDSAGSGASSGGEEGPEQKRRRFPWQKQNPFTRPGMQVERDLAIAEGRYCAPCVKIFRTAAGYQRHRATSKAHGQGAGAGRGGRRRGSRGHVARRGRGGDGEEEEEEGEGEEQVGGEPPAARGPLWHLRWTSASPFRAGQVVAALTSHAADPLPRPVFARLVATVPLPSGETENRFVVLRRFGALYAPSTEGGPGDWGRPRALVPVQSESRNGAVDVLTKSERIFDLLGLGSSSSAPPPPAPPPAPRARPRDEERERGPPRRGRPPKRGARSADRARAGWARPGSRRGSQHAVYLLQSEKAGAGVTYTGSTSCLARRLKEHQTGAIKGAYTAGRGPWRLVAAAWGFADAAGARSFEMRVKKRSGGAKRKLHAMRDMAQGGASAGLAFGLAEGLVGGCGEVG